LKKITKLNSAKDSAKFLKRYWDIDGKELIFL
jgi:hypothetical protein